MPRQEEGLISVVVPVFNEEEKLEELLSRISASMALAGAPWETVFVDDGSTDRSPAMLEDFVRRDSRVKVVSLSRNFGHQPALTAGLRRARGRAVVLMDADLQDPPEVIPALVSAWRAGSEVVRAVRRSRAERGPRRFLTAVFYRVMSLLVDMDMGVDSGVFCLLDRKALDTLISLEERNRYLPGLRSWVGFRQSAVPYDRADRAGGASKQSLGRLFHYAANAVFSFSYKPLRIASFVGGAVCAATALYSTVLVAARLLGINVVPGFTTTTVAVMMLGGLQLLCLGILGEYLARIYDETKRRPLFVEKDFIERPPDGR